MGIHFWHGLQHGPVLDTFNEIVHEWNISHQDWQVHTKEYQIFDKPAKDALSCLPNDQPNLVLAPEYMTGAMITALGEKKIIPIKSLLDNEQLEKIADIIKRTFGDAEGNLACLPINPSCGILFANANLVKEMPKTFEELEAICKDLMEQKKVESGYTCAWPAAYLVEVPAAQRDIALVFPENGKLRFGNYQLSQDWLLDHLLDLQTFQKKKIFKYAGQTNDARIPFINKEVAFFMQGSTHYPILTKEADFPVVAASLPTLSRGQELNVKHAFPLGGAAVWVLDNGSTQQMIDGVREFLNYLASDSVQEKWHKETAYVPVSKELPQKLEEFYQDHPLHKAVVSQTIEATLGQYSFGIQMPNYAMARKELFNLIEKIILNPDLSRDEAKILLQEFDAKYSIPQES